MLLAASRHGRAVVIAGVSATAILGESRVEGAQQADATVLPAGLAVMAAGIRPDAALARDAGLTVNRGIVVDAHLRAIDPDIHAIGECAEAFGQTCGSVAPPHDMVALAAAHWVGDLPAAFSPAAFSPAVFNPAAFNPGVFNPGASATRLKVTGIDLFSGGDFANAPGREDMVPRDPARGIVHDGSVACPLPVWVVGRKIGTAPAADQGHAPAIPRRIVAGRLPLDLACRRDAA